MIKPDIGSAFGTVITVGAGVVALKMVSSIGEDVRRHKSTMKHPTYTRKSYVPKQYSFKPLKWKL